MITANSSVFEILDELVSRHGLVHVTNQLSHICAERARKAEYQPIQNCWDSAASAFHRIKNSVYAKKATLAQPEVR